MKNSGSVIAAFLGGAVIGGLVGAFLMSENGREFRKKVTDLLEKPDASKTDDSENTKEKTADTKND